MRDLHNVQKIKDIFFDSAHPIRDRRRASGQNKVIAEEKKRGKHIFNVTLLTPS